MATVSFPPGEDTPDQLANAGPWLRERALSAMALPQYTTVAFYKGRHRLFDRVVQWWTRGPYSHCELVLAMPRRPGVDVLEQRFEYTPAGGVGNEVLCASASFLDGGVRMKRMWLNPDHWDVYELEGADQKAAQRWFEERWGAGYDIAGLFGFLWRPHKGNPRRWFCSEALAAALGFRDPWRYCVNTLFSALLEKDRVDHS